MIFFFIFYKQGEKEEEIGKEINKTITKFYYFFSLLLFFSIFFMIAFAFLATFFPIKEYFLLSYVIFTLTSFLYIVKLVKKKAKEAENEVSWK